MKSSLEPEQWARYCQLLVEAEDSVRQLRAQVVGGSGEAVKRLLEDLERDGLLTDEFLDQLLSGSVLRPAARYYLEQARKRPRTRLPESVGVAWLPLVLLSAEHPSLFERDLGICHPLRCVVTRSAPVAATVPALKDWDGGLQRVIVLVNDVIARYCLSASPRWALDHCQFELVRGTALPLEPQDRSFELCAALVLVSAALGVELPPGTAAMGFVDAKPESKTRGLVLPFVPSVLLTKTEGLVRSLPILTRVYASVEDAERLHILLPDHVDVIPVGSVWDLPRLLSADPALFRGIRRTTLWSRSWSRLHRTLVGDVGTREEFSKRFLRQRPWARAVWGRLAGEIIGTSWCFTGAIVAGATTIEQLWRVLALSCCTLPLILVVVLLTGTVLARSSGFMDRTSTWLAGIAGSKKAHEQARSMLQILPIALCLIWVLWIAALSLALELSHGLDLTGWAVLVWGGWFLVSFIFCWPSVYGQNLPPDSEFLVAALAGTHRAALIAGLSSCVAALQPGALFVGAVVHLSSTLVMFLGLRTDFTAIEVAARVRRLLLIRRAFWWLLALVVMASAGPRWPLTFHEDWHAAMRDWSALDMRLRVAAGLSSWLVSVLIARSLLRQYSVSLAPLLEEVRLLTMTDGLGQPIIQRITPDEGDWRPTSADGRGANLRQSEAPQ